MYKRNTRYKILMSRTSIISRHLMNSETTMVLPCWTSIVNVSDMADGLTQTCVVDVDDSERKHGHTLVGVRVGLGLAVLISLWLAAGPLVCWKREI